MNTKDITPDPRQLRVDISMAEDLVCEKCNNLTFEPVMMFKKLFSSYVTNRKSNVSTN